MDKKPIIIGALHLPPYGKSNPLQSIDEMEAYAIRNAKVFLENGINMIYIQDENPNMGPATPETIAVITRIGTAVKKALPEIELGIILEAHDGVSPIAVAHACGASFVRIKVFCGAMVKAEGILQGVGNEAVEYRKAIGSNVKIYADAHDRMGVPLVNMPISEIAGWVGRTGADTLIVTGKSYAETLEFVDECKKSGIKKPIIIGGGATIENIPEVLKHCDGAVVSSCLKLDEENDKGQLWDPDLVKKFSEAVKNS